MSSEFFFYYKSYVITDFFQTTSPVYEKDYATAEWLKSTM